MIEVRRCGPGEADDVRSFIDRHWRSGHVLATSPALFDWQYGDPARPGHNLVLAWRGDDLLGVLGYVSDAVYDPGIGDNTTVWLALWKVRDDAGVTGLGLRLLRTLTDLEPHAAIGVLGIGNDRHPAMYRALGYESGECGHYARFRPGAELRLASVPPGFVAPGPGTGTSRLEPIVTAELDAAIGAIPPFAGRLPVKTARYLRARFLEHPFYDYDVHLVVSPVGPRAAIVSRLAEHDGAHARRIVDVVGDPGELAGCGPAIDELLARTGAEHADLWAAGLQDAPLEAAGFTRVDPDGDIVVPNRYEPFVRRNDRLRFAIRTDGRPYAIYRANGDQDRPSELPGS